MKTCKYLHSTLLIIVCVLFAGIISSCSYPRITHIRSEVLLDGIDVDQSIMVADRVLQRDKFGSVLGLWVLRDQIITPGQAETISKLYFSRIEEIHREFNVWHLTWAISNLYRNGSDSVKAVLKKACIDAKVRAKNLNKEIADEKVNGEKVYMGFSHFMGYLYAKKHLVVPGNRKFLQSVEEFRR